jgi:methylphosphotriester-DNA--protein-cysteine methyltransferase
MICKKKLYKLVGENGVPFESPVKGAFGGHRRLKIYGRLDCRSALSWLEKGHYKKHRVFFLTEEAAKKAGYRPCKVCLHDKK